MVLKFPKFSRVQVITLLLSIVVIGVTVGIIVYFGVRDNGSDEGTTTTSEAPVVTDPSEVTEDPIEPPEVTEDPEVTDEPVTGPPEVETVAITIAQGDLLGAYRSTDQNVRFAAFENIPYAQPPVGLLRFREPLPADPWDGVLNATTFGNICVQFTSSALPEFPGDDEVGYEDCLTINVYTPELNPSTPLPVMFVIHGGAFILGSAMHFPYPDLFVEENIVVVTVHYRLGVLGFLSLDTAEVPGNNGMKDLVLALQWVRDNIGDFGGDSDSVTIIGGSAGGAAVAFLQVSPMASGLFHKTISFAGTNLCGWALQNNPQAYTNQFLELLGLATTNAEDMLQHLQDLDIEDIRTAAIAVQYVKPNPLEEFLFVPSIELEFGDVEAFITRHPRDYLTSGDYAQVPSIIGFASYEYAMFYNYTMFQEFFNMPSAFVPSEWNLNDNVTLLNEIYERVKIFYFADNEINPQEDHDILISTITFASDLMFVNGIDESARTMGQHHERAPTYYYRMSYRGQKVGSQAMFDMGLQGAFHGDDILYLSAVSRNDVTDGESDGWIRNRFAKLFSNFAKYGNPTPGPESQLLPIIWDPVTAEEVKYVEFNGELVTSKDPEGYRMDFWRNLRSEALGF